MVLASSTALLLLVASSTSALVPPRSPSSREAIPLRRRAPSPRSYDEWGAWAKKNKAAVEAKYSVAPAQRKRSTGTNLLVNQNADSSFYGSIAVGTPAVSYDVILDTGSSDLWLADEAACQSSSCDNIATFRASASSTFKNTSTPFSITYGSGFASGTLGSDTVQMAGFSVSNQIFAVCDNVDQGLLTYPVSGLMGLAFETIASSEATPFWEALVKGGAWDEPLMTFQLTRYGNDSRAETLEPGGSFTMGFTNNTLYTGDIDYHDIPGGQGTYWIQEISALSIQGNSISIPSGSEAYAAIDTGTTLIAGPSQYVEQIYSNIPGSRPGTGDYDGYYLYPCDTTVSTTIAFGGQTWSISNADFQVTQVNNEYCLGPFFSLTRSSGSGTPSWIIGDTFLKNVYSVFRYSPPSVGFAQLSANSLSMDGANGEVPTPTIGSVAATVAATSRVEQNGAIHNAPSLFVIPLLSMLLIWLSV
ncbi:aspartic peptidase a1 [Moniliophthora roreri MCA 2997]|uniref:Aspartic peptidase a1 n=2 Tax=Moniliophthora roreri TaxID=221103 RepID=V2XQQ4_MONRO|nr:aspartic peptidase a1 [Moniliophthora roreri MCA 2997]KAI3619830.1 aspartic peptidase a1 [Moniliophthora roreri]